MNFPLRQIRHHASLAVGCALLTACASVGPGPATTTGPDRTGAVAAANRNVVRKDSFMWTVPCGAAAPDVLRTIAAGSN